MGDEARHRIEPGKISARSLTPRPSREARLYLLDAEMRAAHFPNARRMSEALGVSTRTIYDDVKHLRADRHAPIAFDKRRNGWQYTESSFALPLLLLTTSEFAALRRSLLAADEYLGEQDTAPLRAVVHALDQFQASHANAAPRVSIGGGSRLLPSAAASGDLLDACDTAIRLRHKLALRYHGAHRNETTERTVRPYHLHNESGEWYVFAHCEWRDALRTFALGRIEQYQSVGDDAAFRVPTDFNAEDLIHRGFHLQHGAEPTRVVIDFDAFQSRWIRERTYHPTQTNEPLADGSLRVTFHVGGLEAVKRWLLAFGAHARVVEPRELWQEIHDEIQRLKKVYE